MSVFPLPLNAIEHYMLADDSAEYPRLFRLVIRLRTNLEESRIAAAFDAAIGRHPLLAARVECEGERPRRWIEREGGSFAIRWAREVREPGLVREEAVEPIDLRDEPALRVRVDRAFDGDVLTLEFHHAAVDGLGALQFVEDVLLYYVCAPAVVESKLRELEETRLATRNAFGLTGWRRPLRWLYGSLGWLGALEYLLHRPVPLGFAREEEEGTPRKSGFLWRPLSDSETRWLRSATRHDDVTLNDRLLRDVFLAMQEWFELHAPEDRKRHKRIMVPMNLRADVDDTLPACNVVAMINVDRKPHHWRSPLRMLRVLHWELSIVKRLRLGVIFVQILAMLQKLFGLERFLSRKRCQATCVVSNLGVVLPEFTNELVSGVEFYPPIRPLTTVAIGAATCRDRLNLSLHYDAAALTTEEAAWLLDRVCALLTAGGETKLLQVHELTKTL
jgi:hypothetical protein